MSKQLSGLGVLVTRPKQQAEAFTQQLEQSGAHAYSFPSIEISPIEQNPQLKTLANDLETFKIIIFISANAVEYGVKWIENEGKSFENLVIASIGKSTTSHLETKGFSIDIEPQSEFTSEGLLEHPRLQQEQITGKHILIIRGQGGRELLADTLKARGAKVSYAEVYKRNLPDSDIQPILELWSKNRIQLVTVTSNEALKNLYHMMDMQGQTHLCKTALLVPSQRCAELAEQLGFTNSILVAASATNEAMLDAISKWRTSTT